MIKLIKMNQEIEYRSRYSDTDDFDHMDRWARIAYVNDIHIAWINKMKLEIGIKFSVSCHFPTLQNDTANQHKVCDTLEEAKEFVRERWEWFQNQTSAQEAVKLKGKIVELENLCSEAMGEQPKEWRDRFKKLIG